MPSANSAAVVAAANALLQAVEIGGADGVPGGIMYAAIMDRVSLGQFESLMSGLVKLGCVKKSGDLYFYQRSMRDAALAMKGMAP